MIVCALSRALQTVLLCLIATCVLAQTGQHEDGIEIVVPASAPPPVRIGAEEIRKALADTLGGSPAITERRSARTAIVLGVAGRGDTPGSGGASSQPESFRIAHAAGGGITVTGADPAGAMYGAFELAEQISAAEGPRILDAIQPIEKAPFLSLRGVNYFLTAQDIDNDDGAFWSDAYWTGFLDLLARSRYNLLDIHGPVDAVSLWFPNGFSYFVSLPGFPEVGVPPPQARRNIARLRAIIRMAGDRGIKVAYMNYEAAPPIGPWQTRRFGVDERWPRLEQEFLRGPRLEAFTREAASRFLAALPELWMFGFRIGESGQPEDFYKKTYLAALKHAPPGLNLYVRTWVADPAKVRELAASTPHRLYVEPKYNGEQLGSPYQAVLGGAREYPASGSYEDYTSHPRNFSILWQIRAHGTHRVFFWGSPEFARRTVRSCRLGDGAGFSMEPMEAYGPAHDYLHNRPETGHRFAPWMYQRQWFWHMVWGRTAFDPDVSDEVFAREFRRRFGEEVGAKLFEAVVESSRIVPFVYAYHSVGLDHQEFAPELETGDRPIGTAWVHRWTGERLVLPGGRNAGFLTVKPIDRTAMADPVTYVDLVLNQEPSGRMTPFEAADYLESAAAAAEQAVGGVTASAGRPEEDCILRDVRAVTALARYYADRIRSTTHLEFFNRTSHHDSLSRAHAALRRAVAHWDELAAVADGHYGYIPDLIRMGVNRFRWKDEAQNLVIALDELNALEMEYLSWDSDPGHQAVLGHVPERRVPPGEPLTLSVSHTGSSGGITGRPPTAISLFYRRSGQVGYTELPMDLTNPLTGNWAATIPAEQIGPGTLEYYFEVQPTRWAHYGAIHRARTPYRVTVSSRSSRPQVSHWPPPAGARGERLALQLTVRSGTPLTVVRAYYKEMPSHREWRAVEMTEVHAGRYEAVVPLTPDGILYYFEAIDDQGSAANYPDFLEQTPYFVVDAWDAPTSPSHRSGRPAASHGE